MPPGARAEEANAVDISATNAIVVDVASGQILFAKAADERVAPASLTKLITAAVVAETIPLDTEITISDADAIGEASMSLQPGETLTVDALLHGMLMASGNDAANAVARGALALTSDSAWQATQRFLDRANARVTQLGMYDTHLVNPHGLDEDGHVSTARDLAVISLHVTRTLPELVAIAGSTEWTGEGHSLRNTNDLLGRYPGLLAGKTGYTEEAGYCLIEIAQRDGREILVVLLGSSSKTWYTDAAQLLDLGFSTPAAAAVEAGYRALTPESSAVGVASANVRTSSGLQDVVRTSPAPQDGQWRMLVVLCVGLASLTLCAGLWTFVPARRARPRDALFPARSAQRSIEHVTREWETQPLARSVDWDTRAPSPIRESSRSGWTAALPAWQLGSLD